MPIDPGNLVVLAVGVVVAALRAPEFVAGLQHGHALRKEQRRQYVAQLPLSQLDDGGIVRKALDSAIPAQIVVVTIGVGIEIGFVMSLTVGNQIAEREAVMCRRKIDAGGGLAAVVSEHVAGTGESLGELADFPAVAPPERSNRVPVAVVPLRPARGKSTELIAAPAHVPGFGDQLDVGERGFGAQRLEKGAVLVEAVAFARQHRRQIESEPIHVHLFYPVFEAVDDQRANLRVLAVDGVAATADVLIEALVLRHEAVVDRIVYSPP